MTNTIYSRANCGACLGTKKQFELNNIPFVEVKVDEDESRVIAQWLVNSGYRMMPVVMTANGAWSGMKLDKILALATEYMPTKIAGR